MSTYAPLQTEFTHGEGAWLFDREGRKYLDALSGIAVCGLGHANPAITAAIAEQAGRLLHISNLFHIATQEELAKKLCQLSGMDRIFFGNSGAEANEAAIKLARLYGNKRGVNAPSIVVMESAFHGRTMATLSASGNRKIQAGFEPLVAGFIRAPFGDIDEIKTIAANNNQVVAVMMEPIQGESGVQVPPEGFLAEVRQLCDANSWLLILDEVQTGNGRTGSFFHYQQADISPDVVTTAKGLGNGVPIGACLARGEAAEVFQPGNHGSTFGGNPLACRTALTVVQEIEKNSLCERATVLGERIAQGLRDVLSDLDQFVEVRGSGLMIGVQLAGEWQGIVEAGLEYGIVLNLTGGNVVRLLPPLILTDAEADMVVERTNQAIRSRLTPLK